MLRLANLDMLKLLRDYLERFQELSAEELGDDLDPPSESSIIENENSSEQISDFK